MDNDALDDLVRRLTALVVKIDERDTHLAARLERYDALLEAHTAQLNELRALTREQVRINLRLETLMGEVFRERHNGPEG